MERKWIFCCQPHVRQEDGNCCDRVLDQMLDWRMSMLDGAKRHYQIVSATPRNGSTGRRMRCSTGGQHGNVGTVRYSECKVAVGQNEQGQCIDCATLDWRMLVAGVLHGEAGCQHRVSGRAVKMIPTGSLPNRRAKEEGSHADW